jgi:hypothetical protein
VEVQSRLKTLEDAFQASQSRLETVEDALQASESRFKTVEDAFQASQVITNIFLGAVASAR